MAYKNPSRAVVRVGVDAAGCMETPERKKNETGIAYAYRTLEYNIKMLKIPPAAFVREAEIADRLKMSKTPVHQAINLLRDQMLIDVKARSATHVSRVDLNAFQQGFFLRSTVEPAIIHQLVGAMPPDGRSELEENLSAQRALIAGRADPYDYINLDDAFHRIMYRAADKGLVWHSIKKVTTNFDRVRYMGLVFGYETPSDREHRQIFDMLADGAHVTEQDARALTSRHLSHYLSYFDDMVRDHPDYFVSSRS